MIELTDETEQLTEDELELLEKVLSDWLLKQGHEQQGELPLFSLVLIDDAAIAGLNARDRAVNGPTDVLSYPVHEPDDDGFPQLPFLGDVFISLDTATQQAHSAGHDLLHEVLVLAAHGFTHLQGYDHRTEEEWKVFEAAQEMVVTLARAAHPPNGRASDGV